MVCPLEVPKLNRILDTYPWLYVRSLKLHNCENLETKSALSAPGTRYHAKVTVAVAAYFSVVAKVGALIPP